MNLIDKVCDALGCQSLADWAYIEGGGEEMFLCEFHGGTTLVDGWVRIERPYCASNPHVWTMNQRCAVCGIDHPDR